MESPKYGRSNWGSGSRGKTSKPGSLGSPSRDLVDYSVSTKENFGRRNVISERREERDRPQQSPKLPKLSGRDSSLGSKRPSRDYRPSPSPTKGRHSQDNIRVGDIKKIDLVITLNDDTTIVVKAAPFKSFWTVPSLSLLNDIVNI